MSTPTLILHGDADRNSDDQRSVALAKQIPAAKLITIVGADHYFPITRGAETRRYINEFVAIQRTKQSRHPLRRAPRKFTNY